MWENQISVVSNAQTYQTPITVLLIDDQPIVGESIRRLLASEPDIKFYFCGDATQAIPTAVKLEPTVILQDLVMPEVDGLMLVKFLRANPATRQIPIIVLSMKDEATIKAEAFATGANDYLVKIPEPIELIARIRYHSTAYINLIKRNEAEKTLEYNKELEKRVEERTAELQKALESLQTTQAQMVHNEKMLSLGQLVAGLAHEINNPINFIYGNLSHLQSYIKNLLDLVQTYQSCYPHPETLIQQKSQEIDLDFIHEDLPRILSSLDLGVERIRNLVRSLKNFSRSDEAELKSVNIHDGIESTLLILQHKLKNIKVIKEYGNLPLIECYPGPLNQVFMNLIANAIDALIASHHSESESEFLSKKTAEYPTLSIRTEISQSGFVTIRIADNGPGIDPQILNRIFDPFFTTKPVGEGTGLGLSISYQIIVEKHRGSLQCLSELDKGTEFIIEIPIVVENY